MKLTKDLIGDDFSLKAGEKFYGFYAAFYSDGQLKEFAEYSSGRPHGWALHLGHNDGTAWVEKCEDEVFKPAEENGSASASTFKKWAIETIDSIYYKGDAAERCSFCCKSRKEVRTLIAGPSERICNECVDVCIAINDT